MADQKYFKGVDILEQLQTKKNDYWLNLREKKSLDLFHKAAQQVPAYKDFLKKNKVDHTKVKTWGDFQQVPVISKKNYIREYPLEKLCWDGTMNNPMVLTATSGSTGEPSYFLRQEKLDWQYSLSIEQFLSNNPQTTKGPTLVIICFGMGIWIGGLITYKAFEIAALRGNYPISIITPGINKKEVFNTLRKLAPQFKQTILIGYAPFIKDIVDQGKDEGVNFKKLNIRLLFAAEAITEEVREYLYKTASINNIFVDFMNIYGSADIGAMATESVTSILAKRLIWNNQELYEDVFSTNNRSLTLAQFNPHFINFEDRDGEVLLTGDNTIPLVRYSIGDNGRFISYEAMVSKLKNHGIDFVKEADKNKIQNLITELPFIFIYERRDFSTSFYGLNVFPDWVRGALITKPLVDYLTGKFTLVTKFDNHQDQFLEINLELRKGKTATEYFKKRALKRIIAYMVSSSSEYKEIYNNLRERAYPQLNFWPAEDPLYFQPGIKQKWVHKNK